MPHELENEPAFSGLAESYSVADDGSPSLLNSGVGGNPGLVATSGPAVTSLGTVPATTSSAVDPSLYPQESNWMAFQDSQAPGQYSFDEVYPIPFAFPQSWENSQAQFMGQMAPSSGPSIMSNISPTSFSPDSMGNSTLADGAPANGHGRPIIRPEVLSTLTPALQEKLKSIAMPAHLRYRSPPQSEPSPHSSSGDNMKDASASPDGYEMGRSSGKKRKSAERRTSMDDEDDDDDDDQHPVKKTAHNMIEKRYRTNLNDKIAALRDSVPSLRIMSKSARGEDTTEDREELQGLTPAHKLNKATVLSKATEYIRHLEKKNNRLADENVAMAEKIKAFQQLLENSALTQVTSPSPMQQRSTSLQYPQDTTAFMTTPLSTPVSQDPPGMIHVPDDMKRIINAQAAVGRPYPVPQQPFQVNPVMMRQQLIQQQQQAAEQNRWQNAGPYFGRLMVGSLAALMIVEAVRENEKSNETPAGRGLLGVPLDLLSSLVPGSHFSIGGISFATPQIISNLKLMVLVGALLWVFIPSLFAPKPPRPSKTGQTAAPRPVPSLASPIHVRRQAWLTAIQTVWVPRHNFVLEALALMLKTAKLSIRNTIGVHGYQMLTGLTQEQEAARVKAWAIALDAQLAGGDVEINETRLTLTLLASWTLPNSPIRLMLKALHVRVLMRQWGRNPVLNFLASKWAKVNWNAARQLKDAAKDVNGEELPDHLAVLLDQDCDDVLLDDVVQRAHNLAWNRSTMHNVAVDVEGLNTVVEDPAVRSPMDAVAAWWSSMALQRILAASLAEGGDAAEVADSVADHLELAVKAAPIGSNAQLRALVARAVLVDEDREVNIAVAEQAQKPCVRPTDSHRLEGGAAAAAAAAAVPAFMEPAQPLMAPDPDIAMALRCAEATAHLSHYARPDATVLTNIRAVMPDPSNAVSLLGCAATFKLMNGLHANSVYAETCAAALEKLAGGLRVLIGGPGSDGCGLDEEVRHVMVNRCIAITKDVVGMGSDTGYGSMTDCEAEEGEAGEC